MDICYSNYVNGLPTSYNPCGCSKRISDTVFICPYGGNMFAICGYVGQCGGVYPPSDLVSDDQLTLFDLGD